MWFTQTWKALTKQSGRRKAYRLCEHTIWESSRLTASHRRQRVQYLVMAHLSYSGQPVVTTARLRSDRTDILHNTRSKGRAYIILARLWPWNSGKPVYAVQRCIPVMVMLCIDMLQRGTLVPLIRLFDLQYLGLASTGISFAAKPVPQCHRIRWSVVCFARELTLRNTLPIVNTGEGGDASGGCQTMRYSIEELLRACALVYNTRLSSLSLSLSLLSQKWRVGWHLIYKQKCEETTRVAAMCTSALSYAYAPAIWLACWVAVAVWHRTTDECRTDQH